MKSCNVMLRYHVIMSCRHGWFMKLEVRRCVCSSHHWPLRWPSTNDERDGPLLIPFDSGFPPHTHNFDTQKTFVYTEKLFHRKVLTEKLLHTANLYRQQAFLTQKHLHREAFTQN